MRGRNDNAHVETAKGVLFLKDFKIAGLDRERLKLVLKSPAREFHMAQVDVSGAGAVASIADRDKESFLCVQSPLRIILAVRRNSARLAGTVCCWPCFEAC